MLLACGTFAIEPAEDTDQAPNSEILKSSSEGAILGSFEFQLGPDGTSSGDFKASKYFPTEETVYPREAYEAILVKEFGENDESIIKIIREYMESDYRSLYPLADWSMWEEDTNPAFGGHLKAQIINFKLSTRNETSEKAGDLPNTDL